MPAAIKTICHICKEHVEPEQERDGKALCSFCEERITGTPARLPEKSLTMKEMVRQINEEQEELFIKVMRKFFRRFSPVEREKTYQERRRYFKNTPSYRV